jgi:hypothetical protein
MNSSLEVNRYKLMKRISKNTLSTAKQSLALVGFASFVRSSRLVINYRFVQRVATQMNALKKGFQDILPLDSIKMFDEKEVEVRDA